MYNDNYPNSFEGNQNQPDNGVNGQGGGSDVSGTETSAQGQPGAFSGQPGQNAGSFGRQDTSGEGYGSYQNRQDNYQYHNYYDERYRGGQQGGYQNQGGGYGAPGGFNSSGYHNGGSGKDGKPPRRKHSAGKIIAAIALIVVFAAFCGGISFIAVHSIQNQLDGAKTAGNPQAEAVLPENGQAAQNDQSTAQIPDKGQIASSGTIRESGNVTAVVTDVTDVVYKVMPACVSITNNFTQQVQDFWGQTYSQDEEASGSGIIIGQNDTELLIVTNNHVVDGADTLHIQFIDGENVEAQVKGTDSSVDLAVIAVKLDHIAEDTKKAICVAQMGDSDSLKIGEPAIAIGNALGYGQSVTTGVISALNRTLEISETGTSNALIQTDAAINPGNSGGALLNINGEVVGINSNKIGGSVVEGMGYAIPISTAKPIIEELMTHETKDKVSDEVRGYLGISCINVTSDLSQNFNMPEGIFVAQVYEGTGAARAGLVRGDIVTAFDGTKVRSQEELTKLMEYYKAGETVEITIMQGSPTGYKSKNVQVVLSSYDELNAGSQKSQEQQQTRP